MKTTYIVPALALSAAALLAGCAGQSPAYSSSSYPAPAAPAYTNGQPEAASYGTVESIQLVRSGGSGASGAGAVAGGLAGALLGNQVGSGSGRSAATVAGAVGGALLGNEVEKNRNQARETYQVNVRFDNGDYRSIMQDSVSDLRVGNRVRLAADGRVYRY